MIERDSRQDGRAELTASPGAEEMVQASASVNAAVPTAFFEDVRTARLDLVAVTPESLLCQKRGGDRMRAELGEILDAEVPDAWPHENWEPHVYDYLLELFESSPEAIGWCRYLTLRHAEGTRRSDEAEGASGAARRSAGRTLIGSFGSGFPKYDTGQAEIGYGILPAYQRNGFAPEAVAAMLPWMQARREIRAFVAQTFPHLRGSVRVLEKSGFHYVGKGFEEGTILYKRECAAFTPPTPSADNEG